MTNEHFAYFKQDIIYGEKKLRSFINANLLWFESFQVFVFLLSVLVTLQQALSSGYLNSVITTIEKRYEIPSSISGIIASMYEIGNVITVIFVSYLGSRRHIPVWIGMGKQLLDFFNSLWPSIANGIVLTDQLSSRGKINFAVLFCMLGWTDRKLKQAFNKCCIYMHSIFR